MMGPLAKTGAITADTNLGLAVLLGFLFGFTLQRLGYTHGTKIGRVFYMRDVDVPIGMFSAIVTAMLGFWGLSLLGLIDTAQFYFLPTYLFPMAVGGVIFGVGMAVGGYCPGTALASTFTGKIDALIFLVGFFIGTLLFGDLFPIWGDFYQADYRGVFRLDQLFGWNLGLVILFIAVVAIIGICVFRRLQSYIWGGKVVCAMSRWEKFPAVVAVGVALLIAFFPTDDFFAIEKTVGSVAGWQRPDPQRRVYLDPLEVGKVLYDNADRTECLDLRPAEQFVRGHLPGALNVDLDEIYEMRMQEGTVALLYGGNPEDSVEALEVLWSAGMRAYVAETDYAELQRLYLAPLTPSVLEGLSEAQQAELRTYRALFQGLGTPDSGSESSVPPTSSE
ncbi:MAG: YeeE/YedE thiosulfate transporter family protein [Pseudomonadota bacterium]